MPIAPLQPMLRMGVWWPSCRCRGIRARHVPCAPADGHRLVMPFDERDRIVHPMRRRQDGSGFDAVSWDEAFS